MNRTAGVILVVLIGLGLGFFGRGALFPPVDRTAAYLALFEAHCVPSLRGIDPKPENSLIYVPSSVVPTQTMWGDEASDLVVIVDGPNCGVLAIYRPASRHIASHG